MSFELDAGPEVTGFDRRVVGVPRPRGRGEEINNSAGSDLKQSEQGCFLCKRDSYRLR